MGNTTIAMEQSRERWSIPWLDHLQQDVRHAVRSLRRSPGFSTGVIATLALGIGANAAMFGVVDRLMYRPLSLAARRIHGEPGLPALDGPGCVAHHVQLRYRRYLDFQEWTSSFDRFAAFFPTNLAIGRGEATREREIAAVSASYFSFFDVRPALGRFFTPDEDVTPKGAQVVILGHGFWQSEYGGRDVIGETLQIGSQPFTIIGVVPKNFTGVTEGKPRAAFIPITTFAEAVPAPTQRGITRDTTGVGWR
jgi:hypothetical protein